MIIAKVQILALATGLALLVPKLAFAKLALRSKRRLAFHPSQVFLVVDLALTKPLGQCDLHLSSKPLGEFFRTKSTCS